MYLDPSDYFLPRGKPTTPEAAKVYSVSSNERQYKFVKIIQQESIRNTSENQADRFSRYYLSIPSVVGNWKSTLEPIDYLTTPIASNQLLVLHYASALRTTSFTCLAPSVSVSVSQFIGYTGGGPVVAGVSALSTLHQEAGARKPDVKGPEAQIIEKVREFVSTYISTDLTASKLSELIKMLDVLVEGDHWVALDKILTQHIADPLSPLLWLTFLTNTFPVRNQLASRAAFLAAAATNLRSRSLDVAEYLEGLE